jgi:hypothetical protein
MTAGDLAHSSGRKGCVSNMVYRYTFTWSDGHTFEVVAKGQWEAQNKAHWERYGQFATPERDRAQLVAMHIEPEATPRPIENIWDLPVFGWAWQGDARDKRA